MDEIRTPIILSDSGQQLAWEDLAVEELDEVQSADPPLQQQSGHRSWRQDPKRAGEVARRARQMVLAQLRRLPPRGSALPAGFLAGLLDWVFVSVYFKGRLRGCIGSAAVDQLDEELKRLGQSALQDARFDQVAAPAQDRQVAVTVSLLCNTLQLGELSPGQAAAQLQRNDQGLMVRQGWRTGLLLPHVASHSNLDRQQYIEHVISKAGLAGPPYEWQRFECTTWLALHQRPPQRLESGFPVRTAGSAAHSERCSQLAAAVAGYLLRNQRPDGSFWSRYHPVQDILYERSSAKLTARAAWVLARASRICEQSGLAEASQRSVERLLPGLKERSHAGQGLFRGQAPCVEASSWLLLALCQLSEIDGSSWSRPAQKLARSLCGQLGSGAGCEIAGLALSKAQARGLLEADPRPVKECGRRYASLAGFCWKAQAWLGSSDSDFDPRLDAYFRRGADSIAEACEALFRHARGCLAMSLAVHGLTPALRLSLKLGDEESAHRYGKACRRLLQGLDRLIVQQGDCALLPNPAWALGGVRSAADRSEILTEEVQLSLAALLELAESAQAWEI